MHRFGAFLVIVLSLMSIISCSESKKRPPLGKVNGKVVYKGEPVAQANVTFTMDGASRAGTGITNDAGEFELTTFDTNDGAIVGTHKVTVVQVESNAQAGPMSVMDLAKSGPPVLKRGAIPPKYADLKTTPLKNTIDPGKNDITIELKD